MSQSPAIDTPDRDTDTLHWRALHEDDLDAAHALSQALGWPHRREDWAMMLRAGEGLALESTAGELIGTGFCFNQGTFATLGLVIVREDWQGRGLGRAIMTRLMALAGDRTQILVATTAGAPLYEKLGFIPCQTVCQYHGTVTPPVSLPDRLAGLRSLLDSDRDLLRALHPLSPVHAEAVQQATDGVVIERDGQLTGAALLRPFGRGEHIGPIMAETFEQARIMVQHLLARREGHFIRLDLVGSPDDEWLSMAGLACVDRIMRMQRGPDISEGPLMRFGLITQAMG